MKSNKGITLIALVITIIVLIILAGVAINLTLGENGIFTRAETAKLKYEIAQAEEELDIKIAELQVEKQGSATLQDVVDMLKAEEDMDYIVSLEEIASIIGAETIGDVDEIYVVYKIYQFRVDDRLQTEFISIVESYTADVQISSTLKSHDGKNEDEKYLATYEIKVESEGQVQSIEIETVDGKITETPTSLPYTKEIQVEIGQKYIIKVTTPDGKYKRYVIEEKAEETIKKAQELAAFRDKVNSGLTYEGKTVTLVNDIDLSSVCGANVNGQEISWEPVGYYIDDENYLYFKGTFDGNNKTINNLYINSDEYKHTALFSGNYRTIKNLIVENANIDNYANYDTTRTAAIIAVNYGLIENCGVNSGTIKCEETFSTESYFDVGSITAWNEGIINKCYNGATIESIDTNRDSDVRAAAGGIAGKNHSSPSKITNCYNKGIVKVEGSSSSGCGGIVGMNVNGATIENSYNYGSVTQIGSALVGGIVGRNRSTSNGIITNSYCIKNTTYSYYTSSSTSSGTTTGRIDSTTLQGYASTLGDAYIADGKIKNENGEWVDNVDSQGNIIYINDGYPILKWQIGE